MGGQERPVVGVGDFDPYGGQLVLRGPAIAVRQGQRRVRRQEAHEVQEPDAAQCVRPPAGIAQAQPVEAAEVCLDGAPVLTEETIEAEDSPSSAP